jgi:UPF0755 protein
MTIRSGGRPRDARAPQAHPYDADAYATEAIPPYSEPVSRGGRGDRNGSGRGGGGVAGIVKFLIFALILGGIVLAVALTALRPLVNNAILGWAADNPAAFSMPIVKDIVAEDIGTAMTRAASTDPAQVEFVVQSGDTAATIGKRLETEGLILDDRAFTYIAVNRGLTGALQQGTFLLRKNMTPDQIVTSLLAPPSVPYVEIALRTGLRLEQVTAKLQTLQLQMDPKEFYDLVKHPPKELLDDYPWLKKVLADAPPGASLEGFLWPSTYKVLPDTTAEELVRLMLDNFVKNVGADRMDVPKSRGLTFYQVLTLASLVEREAKLDEERPLIAGVYQNRLDPKLFPTQLLQSDPTIFYLHDTLTLRNTPFADWKDYVFWAPIKGGLTGETLPDDLAGYNTYTSKGLPPGPLATPTLPSIDAALDPDTKDGYLFFIAKNDGSNTTAFAKTYKQHLKNVEKYQTGG